MRAVVCGSHTKGETSHLALLQAQLRRFQGSPLGRVGASRKAPKQPQEQTGSEVWEKESSFARHGTASTCGSRLSSNALQCHIFAKQ